MRKIQMVDLLSQYEKIQQQVDEAVLGVIRSTAFINGPEVKQFQAELEEYLKVKHVIPCANGTDALQVAMMGLNLQPGDEVITASFTYVATAEVIALLKLTPVLVDVNPDTFCIDPAEIEKAITPKTKAIVPVHLFGQTADMEAILDIAKRHNLFVIEDTAQAIGADYTFKDGSTAKAGTIGTVGCTSFFPSKNLGCYGDGGAIFTNDDELAKKIRMIANHGQSVQYYHDEIGVNSRLDSIQAAILRCKLPHLDSYNARRLEVANRYNEALGSHAKVTVPQWPSNTTHVFHQYTMQLHDVDRAALKDYLASKEIPAMIYYPVPLHMQKAYTDARYTAGMFPVTEQLCASVISLPISPDVTPDQQEYIIENVLNFLNQ
ncbi:MAG: DegT/DnrJ/EryC1/StrS family aminotransferase [Bacteroidetes bacterium]|nr:MAG: DegT/DnrJ/EryC1/StrS family aminotransferase [Bacteroidota bacterium]